MFHFSIDNEITRFCSNRKYKYREDSNSANREKAQSQRGYNERKLKLDKITEAEKKEKKSRKGTRNKKKYTQQSRSLERA